MLSHKRAAKTGVLVLHGLMRLVGVCNPVMLKTHRCEDACGQGVVLTPGTLGALAAFLVKDSTW